MAGLLLGGLVFGFSASTGFAAPAETGLSVNSIIVEGNRRVEAETIRSYFRVGPGEQLDAAKIDAALKALYASGLFEDVRITRKGGHLVVTVVEAPVINRVAFEGNRVIKDDQLKQEIQSHELGALSRATVQADVQRVIEVYHRNGRYDVQVTPQIIRRPNNRVDLIFAIKEGVKTGVKDIRFIGNHAYGDYRLKEVIKSSVSRWWSFLQTTDVYDPDRLEADRDLLRRFYLKHGYADVQVISATGEYDPAQKGFILTFTIEEGPRYRFGHIDIQSNIHGVNGKSLRSVLLTHQGDFYNGEAIEKTVEALTIEIAKHGYPFAKVRPRGDRNPKSRTIGVVYVIDEGARAYIERINVRGNTRTREYVIRREFDIAEGDPYNRALIDRAERRLKNLNFFKSVKITTQPGSAPDRVVINVDVVEQSTGDFSIMGGYSTVDGFMAQVSISERNLMGTGRYAKASVTWGEFIRAGQLSFVEPYLLGYRLSGGIDLFAQETLASFYLSYGTETYGTTLKLGVPLAESLSLQLRYSIYEQGITLPSYLDNCNNINPDFVNTFPTPAALGAGGAAAYPGYTAAAAAGNQTNCFFQGASAGGALVGIASVPVREELAQGAYLTSMPGYGLTFSTLDNNMNPTNGLLLALGQDIAGLGGDAFYLRSTADFRAYYEVVSDLVGLVHLQAGDMIGFAKCPVANTCVSNDGYVRTLDDFKMGPNLVRGIEPFGMGPRDVTPGTAQDPLGGTMYWGASLEFQYPFYFLPKDSGFKGAVFIDSGSVWGYRGETTWPTTGEVNGPITTNSGATFLCTPATTGLKNGCGMLYADNPAPDVSIGFSIIWASPFGPLRFDIAYPIVRQPYDIPMVFQFGGGTTF